MTEFYQVGACVAWSVSGRGGAGSWCSHSDSEQLGYTCVITLPSHFSISHSPHTGASHTGASHTGASHTWVSQTTQSHLALLWILSRWIEHLTLEYLTLDGASHTWVSHTTFTMELLTLEHLKLLSHLALEHLALLWILSHYSQSSHAGASQTPLTQRGTGPCRLMAHVKLWPGHWILWSGIIFILRYSISATDQYLSQTIPLKIDNSEACVQVSGWKFRSVYWPIFFYLFPLTGTRGDTCTVNDN